jgi:hypothetical protein
MLIELSYEWLRQKLLTVVTGIYGNHSVWNKRKSVVFFIASCPICFVNLMDESSLDYFNFFIWRARNYVNEVKYF